MIHKDSRDPRDRRRDKSRAAPASSSAVLPHSEAASSSIKDSLRGGSFDEQEAALSPHDGAAQSSPVASSSKDAKQAARIDKKFVRHRLREMTAIRDKAWQLHETGASPENVTQFMSSASVEWLEGILIAARADYGEELPDFALIAIGSLTRGEMTPESDIDLCFIAREEHHKQIEAFRDHLRTRVLPLFARSKGGMQTDFEGGVEGVSTPERFGAVANKGRDFMPMAVAGGDHKATKGEAALVGQTDQAFDAHRDPDVLRRTAADWAVRADFAVRSMGRDGTVDLKGLLRSLSMTMSLLSQMHGAGDASAKRGTVDRMHEMASKNDPLGVALGTKDKQKRKATGGKKVETSLLQRLQHYYAIIVGWRLDCDRANPGGKTSEQASGRDVLTPDKTQQAIIRELNEDMKLVIAALGG